jgi:FkbM family methyltransferase
MGKTGKLSSEFQPAAPPKPQRSVPAPLLPPFSAAECKGAPFFTDLRIAGMIKAAQSWKETNDGQAEEHLNDSPHGVEHFDFLGALLDAAPSHAVKLLVDVGANQGGFTRFAALRGFAAIGFEALSRNAVYVRGKLQESKLNNHAIVVSAAMWSHAGQLFELNDNGGNGQVLQKNGGQTFATDESNIVSSAVLDSVVQHDAYFLKLDVEGCENRVIVGAQCLLRSHNVRFIFFEFSPSNMRAVSGNDNEGVALLDNLAALGYRLFISDCSHNIEPHVVALLPTGCADHNRQKEFVADIVKENWSAVAQYEIIDRTALVSVLESNFKSIHCCLVNVLAVKPLGH